MTIAPREFDQARLSSAKQNLLSEGWCILPGILNADEARVAVERLWRAAEESRRRGGATYAQSLDPNEANVRVFGLLELDQLFRDLIRHPVALDLVRSLLGDEILISNFTANIARPGAGSMSLHSDQALVVPEPWLEPWAINIIWCLADTRFENGGTQYLPGSHRISRLPELDPIDTSRMKAFEAPAGSIVAMDGRMWHTSGPNQTPDEDRPLLFGYYTRDFLRPQVNWNAALSAETIAELDEDFLVLLGLEGAANVAQGRRLLSSDLGGLKGMSADMEKQ